MQMRFQLSHDRRNIADEDLLADLRRVVGEQAGQTLAERTYKDFGKYGVTTVIRRFGSWSGALAAAGIEHVERNISNKDLLNALYELWVKLGRQPRYSEVRKPTCRYSAKPFEQRFGSWRKALESFVEYVKSDELTASTVQLSRSEHLPRRTPRSINLSLRFKTLRRDGFRCCSCGASPSKTPGVLLQVDHIKPWSKDGETVLENLQTLCFTCNQGKGNRSK